MSSFRETSTLALNSIPLARSQAMGLVDADFHDLLYEANRIRARYHGAKVSLCSIVNARSGTCSENCAFCAQSSHHDARVETFAMLPPAAIVEAARVAEETPIAYCSIVTSGRNAVKGDERERLLKALHDLGASTRAAICVSLGGIDNELLQALKKLGVQRIHHNLETSRRFFPNICTTHTYNDRLDNVKRALDAGFEVCCGGLFGMGESWEDRTDLAIEIRDLGVRSVPLNFLNAIPGTPLAHLPPLPPRDILRTIALFRFILPRADIRIAGGREVNLRDLQSWCFYAGATGVMAGNYLTTSGRSAADDVQMVEDLGLYL